MNIHAALVDAGELDLTRTNIKDSVGVFRSEDLSSI